MYHFYFQKRYIKIQPSSLVRPKKPSDLGFCLCRRFVPVVPFLEAETGTSDIRIDPNNEDAALESMQQ